MASYGQSSSDSWRLLKMPAFGHSTIQGKFKPFNGTPGNGGRSLSKVLGLCGKG